MKALVVDGYNAIYKIASLKKALDRSLEEARKQITELAKEYQRKSGGIDKVCVVFDGKDAYRDNRFLTAPNQVFSKTGEGDKEVIRTVKRLSSTYHVVVVTDDNFIRNNSRAYNATVIGISKFVTAFGKGKKKTKEDSTKKVTPEIASKINEELKKHWKI